MDSANDGTARRPATRRHFFPEYRLFTLFLIGIAGYAYVLSNPFEVWDGLQAIIASRSLLVTDYLLVGGPGAMLMNGALAGGFALALLFFSGVKPNGATIMALWMTVGFGFFGKNVFNMLPLTAGVWLYAKVQKEPFINYSLAALTVATLSPVVSELAFGFDPLHLWVGLGLGVLLGLLAGFLFPIVSAFTVRVHDGYNLYNMGFAGGIMAMFIVAGLKAGGITIETASLWGGGYDAQMAGLLYAISVLLILAGLWLGRERDHIYGLKRILRSSGRLVSDYYTLYGQTSYINMGLLGIVTTTIALLLGININGPVMGGILTIIAFGCFGNHVRNVLPIMAGAVLATWVNVLDTAAPGNALAVLFSAGLAPVAGQFGVFWGIVTGFVHVSLVNHTGYMSNGLNLYNNGLAAGFVAMLLVPVIVSLKKIKE